METATHWQLMPSGQCWSRTGTPHAQGWTHRPTAMAPCPPAPGAASRAPLSLDSPTVPALPSPCWTAPLHSQRHETLSQSLRCCQIKGSHNNQLSPNSLWKTWISMPLLWNCPHDYGKLSWHIGNAFSQKGSALSSARTSWSRTWDTDLHMFQNYTALSMMHMSQRKHPNSCELILSQQYLKDTSKPSLLLKQLNHGQSQCFMGTLLSMTIFSH